MAISYSGIVGYGKLSLPSVESWGTNNNILKDPPRSVTTRRRDKVGLNSTITQEVEMSRDRVAEVIKAYPRGVNPMVGVSYNGAGNGGIGSGQALLGSGQQAKLPYRVAMAGAFRPPVLAPVDLLPLSRMPRLVTKVNCSVNNPDFQKKLSCGAEKRTYKQRMMQTSCAPRIVYNIKKPSEVIDRRHENTRKNVASRNVMTKKALPAKGSRENNGELTLHRKIIPANMLNVNKAQKKFQSGMKAGVNVSRHVAPVLSGNFEAPVRGTRNDRLGGTQQISRAIANPLRTSAVAHTSGPRKEQTSNLEALNYDRFKSSARKVSAETRKCGPNKNAAVSEGAPTACRGSVFKTSIEPVNVIERTRPGAAAELPQFKRAFGRGGVLAPEGGNYNQKRSQ
jgi:hypothetical protein